MDNLIIRSAEKRDIPAMLAIYAPYVERTAISFEYTVPSEQEFCERVQRVQSFYPWLVAELEGRVAGYAYASRFHPRAAYDWSTEVSIYLADHARGKGLGRRLYGVLESALRSQNILTAYACIAWTNQPDEFLDHGSPRFHERMGYHTVGTFSRCGFKFGRWYGMIWMEKRLAPEGTAPVPIVAYKGTGEKG